MSTSFITTTKKQMIYQDTLNDGREKGWYEDYIHFSHSYQHFLQHLTSDIGWSLQTYSHVLHHLP